MILKFLIFSICLKIASSLPNGSPSEACEDLIPRHGINQPRPVEEMPVDVLLESTVIRPGELTSISLRARNDTMFGPLQFRGFLIQARVQGANAIPGRVIGTFELTDGVQHLFCPTLTPNSVVTHSSGNEKAYLQLLWRAPANIFEDHVTVNFYYTIVWLFPMFWANAVSSPLIIENPVHFQNPYENL